MDEEDDDIIPGSYTLDIDIDDIYSSSLWIRADYIRTYDCFQAHYDLARPGSRPPSAVLTGQLGIGKSLWVYYTAHRRASEMKPFIWYYAADHHLLVEEGAPLTGRATTPRPFFGTTDLR